MNSARHLHIVCFDIPFPADYGGAIEEWYKIKTLAQLGIKIHLHCFEYNGRKPDKEIDSVCEKVYYYKRERKLTDALSKIPFIVKSRMQDELLQNLCKDNYPILFDATHTTGFINHPALKKRKKIVRLHNIEWIYYRVLLADAVSLKEKIYYFSEYKKLKKYDSVLANADFLSCLSQTDLEYYQTMFPEKSISFEAVFHENTTVTAIHGKGDYILYHGNLSLTDNYAYVIELIEHQLKSSEHQIIIAGRNPDEALRNCIAKYAHITLIANPNQDELALLVKNAQVCLAFARNPSGVKLKLINSLFQARFVIANEAALTGSNLSDLVISCETEDLNSVINQLMQQEFTTEIIEKRKNKLLSLYNNQSNAEALIKTIYHG